jgi:hypothetical protein
MMSSLTQMVLESPNCNISPRPVLKPPDQAAAATADSRPAAPSARRAATGLSTSRRDTRRALIDPASAHMFSWADGYERKY